MFRTNYHWGSYKVCINIIYFVFAWGLGGPKRPGFEPLPSFSLLHSEQMIKQIVQPNKIAVKPLKHSPTCLRNVTLHILQEVLSFRNHRLSVSSRVYINITDTRTQLFLF